MEGDTKLLIKLISAFFLATVIGTLSHEAGHCLAVQQYAKAGTVRINYMASFWEEKDHLTDTVFELGEKDNRTTQEQERYETLFKEYAKRQLTWSLGGPLLTILIGTIGWLLLLTNKPSRERTHLPFLNWLYIFLALFWLRPVYILLSWIVRAIFGPTGWCDEKDIAAFLQWPDWVIILPAGLVGTAVAVYVFLYYVPKQIRFTALLAAAISCPLSFTGWFYWIGPRLLP
jgi:hypothetical protein